MFSDPIFGVSVEDRDRFIKYIRCSSILMKDAQIENLLQQHDIRKERSKKAAIRESAEEKLGINYKRRMNLPFYNMNLSRDQFNKLFKGIPFRKGTLRRKQTNKLSVAKLRLGSARVFNLTGTTNQNSNPKDSGVP